MLDQHLAEDVGPGVVVGDPHPRSGGRRQSRAIAPSVRDGGEQIDAGKALECGRHRQKLRLGKRIGDAAAKRKSPDPGRLRRMGDDHDAIGHHGVVARIRPVPFEHGEFRQMQTATLAIAKHPGKLEDPGFTGSQQLLAGEFRRGPQIPCHALAIGADKLRARRVQMGLIARRNLQNGGFDLGKALLVEPGPGSPGDGGPCRQKGPDVGVPAGRPPWRKLVVFGHQRARKTLASTGKISMLQPETASLAAGRPCPDWSRARISGKTALKVIASSIRKGNVIEQDGKLYVVLTAENIHPGKGTPVSQIEMRRISDGVKISERYKTTDQVEKATIEDQNFNYLYKDADGFHFMNNDNYDQVQVPEDIIGSAAPYLQENMTVKLSLHGLIPVAIQMPQRATLEVVETEPVTQGQTASSSYKPAILSNGVRTNVPPHIGTGTRIVVMTEDGSYVERAKD